MKKIIHDMSIYKKVDDRIFGDIERSKESGLTKAREIMERIHRRDIYLCVGVIQDAGNKVLVGNWYKCYICWFLLELVG